MRIILVTYISSFTFMQFHNMLTNMSPSFIRSYLIVMRDNLMKWASMPNHYNTSSVKKLPIYFICSAYWPCTIINLAV